MYKFLLFLFGQKHNYDSIPQETKFATKTHAYYIKTCKHCGNKTTLEDWQIKSDPEFCIKPFDLTIFK